MHMMTSIFRSGDRHVICALFPRFLPRRSALASCSNAASRKRRSGSTNEKSEASGEGQGEGSYCTFRCIKR